jgi:hypothetical protein
MNSVLSTAMRLETTSNYKVYGAKNTTSNLWNPVDFLFDIYYNTPMGTQSDYFNEKGYKPKYWIGDRVFGHWNNIPFVGTVGNDTVINEANGPQISIHLDLPIRFRDKTHNIIIVKHKDVKKLVEMS